MPTTDAVAAVAAVADEAAVPVSLPAPSTTSTTRATSPASVRSSARLSGLDIHRGFIMAAMALDHASVFIARTHAQEFWGATLPAHPDAFWFWTRWISHLCAPGFAFLMGVGMVMLAQARRRTGWTEGQITRFFVTRGLVMIVLQLFVEDPAWILGIFTTIPGAAIERGEIPGGGTSVMLYVGVLYSLGACMIFWGVLMRAPGWLVATVGAAAILVTQLGMPDRFHVETLYSPLVRLLLIPGHTNAWQVFYPLVPWIGVTALGLLMGRLLTREATAAMRIAGQLALGLLVSFVVIRLGGGFGNLNEVPPGPLGFLLVVKYPPSLAYLTITLALNLAIMSQWNRLGPIAGRAANWLAVFGQCAMMFYLVHLWVYALLGLLFRGGSSLPQMYAMWLVGLAIMYPFCRWYNAFKRTTAPDSIWRFF